MTNATMRRFVEEQREAHLSILGASNITTNELGVTYSTLRRPGGSTVTVLESAASPAQYLADYGTVDVERYGVTAIDVLNETAEVLWERHYVRFHAIGRDNVTCVSL